MHALSRLVLGEANADEIFVFRETKLGYLSTYSRRYHIRQTSLFVYFCARILILYFEKGSVSLQV